MKTYYVYILTSSTGTLYTGVTNDLFRRVYEHKQKLVEGFTKKYNIDRLVYYEETHDVNSALLREKQVKGWLRKKKFALMVQQTKMYLILCKVCQSISNY